MKTRMLLHAVLIAFLSSIATVLVIKVLPPAPAFAQQSGQPPTGFTLYAYHRRSTDTEQGFVFFDPKSGDIWVYDNENAKEHYRVTQIGQKLEKLK